jgi:hypothetical protein
VSHASGAKASSQVERDGPLGAGRLHGHTCTNTDIAATVADTDRPSHAGISVLDPCSIALGHADAPSHATAHYVTDQPAVRVAAG